MIRLFENITDEQIQEHVIVYNDVTANVTLRYNEQVQSWTFDCVIGNKAAYGIKLSCGVLHMISRNMPIDFVVVDLSGNDIDPFLINDFSDERCRLFILDDQSMEEVRGLGVEI